MRTLAVALALAILVAGCTTADQPMTGTPRAMDESQLWAPAAASHEGRLELRGASVTVRDVEAHVETIVLNVSGATHLAFRNVSVGAERGWVLFENGAQLRGAGLALANATLTAQRGAVVATLAPALGAYVGDAPFAGVDVQAYEGVVLPARGTLTATNVTFRDAAGASRGLASTVELGFAGASVHAIGAPFGAPLEADVGRGTHVAWDEEVRIEATSPLGNVTVDRAPHALSGRAFSARFVGAGSATLFGEGTLSPVSGRVADVVTDGTPRLGARLRLAPDTLEASGPAGNVTRVKILLAEASGGADAHVLGFRVDGTAARYVGSEPFAMTEELLDLIRETEGPLTPAVVLTVGLALPFVALVEGIAGFFTALFPPSIAGVQEAGTARVVTFELLVPEVPKDVEITIEAQNAPATRAVVRMTPSGS